MLIIYSSTNFKILDVEKLSKMKKLLDILSSPNQRMPLETLLKCEVVLEKLDFKRGEGSVSAPTAQLTFKEHHAFNPLLEAINNLQTSVMNHTLHRTFGPTLDALFGPELKYMIYNIISVNSLIIFQNGTTIKEEEN